MNLKDILTRILIGISVITICGCNDPDHDNIYFIGDSIIARWDLDEYFSGYVTTNLGISGAGIDYIESLSAKESNRDIVIMIGTNNMSTDLDIDSYAQQYVDAIKNLDARRVYLFSILPRDFNGEASLLPVLKQVNECIKSKISDISSFTYIDVYDKFIYDGHIDYALYSDRLHLSPQGYEILSKALHKNL